jgi:hypothetical protein
VNDGELDRLERAAALHGVRSALLMAYHEGRAEAYQETFGVIMQPEAVDAGLSRLTELVANAEARSAAAGGDTDS